MSEKRVLKDCGHHCRKNDAIDRCCNCRTWSKNDCDLCKDEPFELTMKAGTVFYEKKQLEDRLKEINEVVKDLHAQLKARYEEYYDPWPDISAQFKVDKIKELSDV